MVAPRRGRIHREIRLVPERRMGQDSLMPEQSKKRTKRMGEAEAAAADASAAEGRAAEQARGAGQTDEGFDERMLAALHAACEKKALRTRRARPARGGELHGLLPASPAGTNARQVQAIADAVEEQLKKRGTRPAARRGLQRRPSGCCSTTATSSSTSSRRRRGASTTSNACGATRRASRSRRSSPPTREARAARRRFFEKREVIELVARSESMREALRLAGRVAATDANVLVTGESGAGKDAARALRPRQVEARGGAVRQDRLRGAARRAVGGGAVRLRARRLHRRDAGQARQARSGAQGHARPRRDRAPLVGRAGEALARHRAARVRASGRSAHGAGGRAARWR